MELVLPLLATQQLSGTIPVIFDRKTNKVAQPNTSLAHPKKVVKWECSDWVIFHKGLVEWFKEGRFASKKKYPEKEAIAAANQIVMQHWERNATFTSSLTTCGYGSAFYSYFVSVGMGNVVTNTLQKIANVGTKVVDNTVESAGKIATSVTDTLVNTVDDAGKVVNNLTEGAGNLTGMFKYLAPIAITGGVLLIGGYVYKNFIKGDSRVSIPTPGGFVKV